MPDLDYLSAIQEWRARYERDLTAEDGWLAIAGLAWLPEGASSFGSAPGNDIRLPAGSTTLQAGWFFNHVGTITLQAANGTPVSMDGQPVASTTIPIHEHGSSDPIKVGRLTLYVIQRGPRYGLRIYDPESPARRSFAGCQWFPVDETYHLQAAFVPSETPASISITNVLGLSSDMPSPGFITFQLNGQEYRLTPLASGDKLFFIFRDATNGRITYPAGRYLYADPPKNGIVTLDFNKAYSPPCAFTPYATCPLPPQENRLPVPIFAGEMQHQRT